MISRMSHDAPRPNVAAEHGLQYDFDESIGYWLVLASQAFQKALGDELQPHGITFRQCQVLGWLVLEGELSQRELAERMMIEPATLAGVLDRMERESLVHRQSAARDRRRKLVRISVGANRVWEQAVVCARRVRERAARGMTAAEVENLRGLLRRVLGNLADA
jgi:MarR family transcriptional regulator, transcriptional regulator for hemolysin